MAKIRYRPSDPWKRLTKFLNSRHSVELKVLKSYLYHNCFDFLMKSHINILIKLRFCERRVCVNQNKTKTVKIILKRRIPKKLTLDLANEMLEKPWLAWFMYPE